ncbi:MAG: acetyl-CoA carboxylase biotin carboxylase subunit [Bacteroidales bacterium]|nr:acetyl-CoA carboxylase biotin carboxylase subunit [Bacteroidales bacterium]
MKSFKKILIANRGEIAVRIMKTAKKMGIKTVAVYSEPDKGALHTRMADEAVLIGGAELSESYLNVDKIIQAAKETDCDALHPGYGFLSENALLVDACDKEGVVYIGPDTRAMKLMGNKIEARAFVNKLNVPMTEGVVGTPTELIKKALTLDYPILIKAAAGGGGKGMRILYDDSNLKEMLESTSREAKNYFGDGSIYIEKYIEEPRHIEIQVMGDNYGNVVHLFERECSIQRRYQKIIEESPSPTLTPEVRNKMGNAAVSIAKAVGYNSAGTVEFLVDNHLNFYFLEMNTRIQVEHPVTEMVTGVDLVEEQIRVAQGYPLSLSQDDLKQNGHAIECRIYAEDAENNFLPAPGKMSFYQEPVGDGIRIDSSVDTAVEVQSLFDPMISKMVVWGQNRQEAIDKSIDSLQHYVIQGVKTNISYLKYLLEHPAYQKNQVSTKFCEEHTAKIVNEINFFRNERGKSAAVLALALHILNNHKHKASTDVWNAMGFWRIVLRFSFILGTETMRLELTKHNYDSYEFDLSGTKMEVSLVKYSQHQIDFRIFQEDITAYISVNEKQQYFITVHGVSFVLDRTDELNDLEDYSAGENASGKGSLFAPMPGKVIKVNVNVGDKVHRGSLLLVVEAMKMENNIIAMQDAIVEKINVKEGDRVDTDLQLITLKTEE